MSVGVTRSTNVVMTPADKQKAFENGIAARRRPRGRPEDPEGIRSTAPPSSDPTA